MCKVEGSFGKGKELGDKQAADCEAARLLCSKLKEAAGQAGTDGEGAGGLGTATAAHGVAEAAWAGADGGGSVGLDVVEAAHGAAAAS